MLLKFTVENFRSMRDRIELDMTKSALKGHTGNYFEAQDRKLLSTSVIYGANASGKSGFLRAFQALEYLVLKSADFKLDKTIASYEPFLLDEDSQGRSVKFEIDYISNDNHYEYIVSYSRKEIETEELSIFNGNYKSLLFSRERGKDIKFGDSYRGGKKLIERMTLPNQLFLSKAVENNVELLLDAYRFFDSKLRIYPILEGMAEEDLKRLYARRLAEDAGSSFSRKFNALICALDTGITQVSAEETNSDMFHFPDSIPSDVKVKFLDRYRYDIKTYHNVFKKGKIVGQKAFDVRDESAGTKNLFALGGIIIEALEEGHVLVVDELEKNLHPDITTFLIRLFHRPDINRNRAQLIFATHDVSQLSHDTFRRDQVWFVEKDECGASTMFRCSDIEGVRADTPLDKWYMAGRLGATPVIQDENFLVEMQED
ncbi:ATP-binding protein [Sphingobacterium sp. SGG-5]|uniref:AAA family ATPase n=1 Tax=Sphingobacterium sp. SGG-5 TaxID=2710881 RepID=UPI0013EAE0F8|nr:ATP-binding protein [Sphingobacterium sp. SGG-5]NGM62697.1 ATP-binding protein [Sphingobacterium sp. SGG-5]